MSKNTVEMFLSCGIRFVKHAYSLTLLAFHYVCELNFQCLFNNPVKFAYINKTHGWVRITEKKNVGLHGKIYFKNGNTKIHKLKLNTNRNGNLVWNAIIICRINKNVSIKTKNMNQNPTPKRDHSKNIYTVIIYFMAWFLFN